MHKSELNELCSGWGADLFGVADVSSLKDEFLLSESAKKKVKRAISLGVRVSGAVLDEISDKPTKIYFHHYRTLNMFLDQMALRLANLIQGEGFFALPIPASQIVDWQKQNAHLSHKKIGLMAGLGWIGRNNLLVNERLGSQFRLVTVLTDMDLEADKPLNKDCGTCKLCMEVCPANAIKQSKDDFDHVKCLEKLKEFQSQHIVDQYICGVCVKACKGKTGGTNES
ncbi:MAG: epoxyqueuosine reductase [Candidatus Omnitrophica bacterium]|nr:epoxyqueuosine reductase [Candidatus Omnitrophota bacterium]